MTMIQSLYPGSGQQYLVCQVRATESQLIFQIPVEPMAEIALDLNPTNQDLHAILLGLQNGIWDEKYDIQLPSLSDKKGYFWPIYLRAAVAGNSPVDAIPVFKTQLPVAFDSGLPLNRDGYHSNVIAVHVDFKEVFTKLLGLYGQ